MLTTRYLNHNRFKKELTEFYNSDPHLYALSQLKYQHDFAWWKELPLDTPGIYILTGGRQIGKSTSCKLLIKHCLQKKLFTAAQIFYLACDEVYEAKELAEILREFLTEAASQHFLLIVDEITFVKHWDRVIKALADEGYFTQGVCILTGSDTLILKEAAMSFPGRRGKAAKVDFHLYPLSFHDYVKLREPKAKPSIKRLAGFFQDYLLCGGYLRAINDLAQYGAVTPASFLTYEQWIRGDFLKQGKSEHTLLLLLQALLTVGVSQISYSALTQKIGLISKETCLDYCRLLERMDILFDLQAFDQNKKMGFPKKARKLHFVDPFIYQTVAHWLKREGHLNSLNFENTMVEACVASHCRQIGKTYYFKGQGEVDVIWQQRKSIKAIEVKWAEQIRSNDLKALKLFNNSIILIKAPITGKIEHIESVPVYQFLFDLGTCPK